MSDQYKNMKFDMYGNTTDPKEYLEVFKNKVLIHGASDFFKCKFFLGTLLKGSLARFTHQPTHSIVNFADFFTKFLDHFYTQRVRWIPLEGLFNVKEKFGEPRQDYLSRFRNASIYLTKHNPHVFISAFSDGLRSTYFNKILIKNRTKSMEEIRERVVEFINEEEGDVEKLTREAPKLKNNPSSSESREEIKGIHAELKKLRIKKSL